MTHEKQSPRAGQFIVKLGMETISYLNADEVVALLDATPTTDKVDILRIHRVDENGRMELVGVSKAIFNEQNCFIFAREDEQRARTDYEQLVSAASASPLPCTIDIELSTLPASGKPHAIAMIFAAACTDAVGHWLNEMGLKPGDTATGGLAALSEYRAAGPNVLTQQTLPHSPSS